MNVTITLDDALAARARAEADRAGKSLSRYIADLIAAEEARLRAERAAALSAFFEVAKAVKVEGPAYKFSREEIYDEALSRYERGDLRLGSARSGEAGALRSVAEPGGADKFAHDLSAGLQRNAKRRGPKAKDKP